MEEIKIELKCQQDKKQEIQIAITKMTDYRKWPSDKEFLSLHPMITDLIKVQEKIDVLEEVICAIESNTKYAQRHN